MANIVSYKTKRKQTFSAFHRKTDIYKKKHCAQTWHPSLLARRRETGQVPIPSNLLSLLYTTVLDGQLGAHGQDPVSKEQVNVTHRNKIDT